jgi:hypothetical protein
MTENGKRKTDNGFPESGGWNPGSSSMRLLVPLLLLLAACSPVATAVQNADSPERAPVEMSVSLYVVYASESPTSSSSSERTVAEIEEVFTRMRAIWDQGGINLTLATAMTITAPEAVLQDLAAGDTRSFFDAAGVIEIPDPGAVLGFYVKEIGGVNGLTPLGTRVFFVADRPTVHDERVSSHEIGHILGLSHTLRDSGRLMFSGTNGTDLTDEESVVARYGATAILDGVR